jgi:hypothetical protein
MGQVTITSKKNCLFAVRHFYREAIAVFSRASRSAKSFMQLNANAFNCSLRESAVNKIYTTAPSN